MKIKKFFVTILILFSILCVTGATAFAEPQPYRNEDGSEVYNKEEVEQWNNDLINQYPNRVDQVRISGAGVMYDNEVETYTADVQMIAGGSSSGVEWSVSGPAHIDQNGRLTPTGGDGTAVIRAKAKDPSVSSRLVTVEDGQTLFYYLTYRDAQFSVNIKANGKNPVQPANQAVTGITLNKNSLYFGHEPDGSWFPASATLTANLQPAGISGKTVHWYDDSPGIEVQSTGPNTCVVTPTNFTIAIPIITITAECDNQVATCQVIMISRYNEDIKIILNRSSETISTGGSFSLDATVTSKVATPVTLNWSSSAPNIAKVDNNGNVTGISAGTAKITATARVENSANGLAVIQAAPKTISADCQVTVTGQTSKDIAVKSIKLTPNAITMEKGEVKKITETIEPANATNRTVSWGSSASNVVSVDSSGNITAQGPGEALITATASNGVSAHTIVDVKKTDYVAAPTNVLLSINNKILTVGEEVIIAATVEPAGTVQAVEWSSSNQEVAVVNQGKVTAHKPGNAIITAKTPTGVTGKCTITVNMPKTEVKRVSNVSLDASSKTLKEGDSFILKDTFTPADATDKAVKWESSKPEVATVSAGKVTAIKKGSTVIKVTTDDGQKTAQCTVTVEEVVKNHKVSVTGVKLNQTSGSIQVGDSLPLNQTISPSDATDKAVKWFSSNDQILKVSSDGVVVGVGAGTATVSVVTEDGQKTAECQISVKAIAEDTQHQVSSPGIVQPAPDTPSQSDANPDQPQPENPGTPENPEQTVQPEQPGKIYRLYNEANQEHLYTTDASEAQALVSSGGWKDESENSWISPDSGDPVYRLYNEAVREHLYTKDLSEVNALKNAGWTVDNQEKPLFYSGGDKPIYRVYHEGIKRHHLTTDESEYRALVNGGWNDEQVAFYAVG